jgi:tetratricopeptide (TPR) repeat protein
MNRTSALAAALAALLVSLPAADAQAQRTSTSRGQRPVTEDAEEAPADKAKPAESGPKYPDTSRPEPDKPKADPKVRKLYDLLDKQKYAEAITRAEELLADADVTPVQRAHANYIAGYAAIDLDDYPKAIGFLQQAIEADQLTNDAHFTVMFQVAQMQLAEQNYAESLKTIDKFLAQSHSTDPKGYAIKGNALYRLDRFAEAITVLKQANAADPTNKQVNDMLLRAYLDSNQLAEAAKFAESMSAAAPDDTNAQLELATVYANADQGDKAAALVQRLRAAGQLKSADDYERGYRILYNVDGKERETAAMISEGLDKGMLKPSAQIYSALGQSYYQTNDMPAAITAWEKGAPMAKDGEMYLNLSKANGEVERHAASRTAAQSALSKGVKRPGDAWTVIAHAERGLGNKAAELAAWREAAKDPSTRAQAERMIKSLSGK